MLSIFFTFFSSSSCDHSDQSIHEGELEALTMEDLVYSSEFKSSSACKAVSRISSQKRDSPSKSRNKVIILLFIIIGLFFNTVCITLLWNWLISLINVLELFARLRPSHYKVNIADYPQGLV